MIETILYALGLLAVVFGVKMSHQSNGLKEDFREAPLATGYKNAEIVINGQHHLGIATLKADVNQPFSFSVGGVHRGEISVSSEECEFSETKHYDGSGLTEFKIPASTFDRCLFNIFVTPQFTAKEADKIQWRGMHGVILVRKSKNALLRADQYIDKKLFHYAFEVEPGSRVYLKGCGFDIDQKVKDDYFELDEKNYNPNYEMASGEVCIMDGFVKSKSGKILDLAFLWSSYSEELSKLSQPQIRILDGKLEVMADTAASLISFDGETIFKNQGKFEARTSVIRFYTSKGRYGFCDLVEGSGFRCWQ